MVRAAIDSGDVDALAEYVDGLQEDLQESDQVVRETKVDAVKVGALKHRSDIREKVAAALGVVTRREGREHSGRIIIHQFGEADGGGGLREDNRGDTPAGD